MFIDIINHPDLDKYDLTSLNTALIGGSTIPRVVAEQCCGSKLHISNFFSAFGCTETSPLTYLSYADDSIERRCTTVGGVMEHTEAKIVDGCGNILPIGEQGEICTRGYSTMLGYWNDEEKTNESISKSQWYHTGDLVVMDSDGYVVITGRKKDMIIRGGENIYPAEIEQFLYKHPAVEDVQVIGVPDRRMGEEVCAAIRVHTGHTVTEQDIKDFCKGKISHFKIPRYVWFLNDYPLTVTGKVQKFIMRKEAVKVLGLEHEAP